MEMEMIAGAEQAEAPALMAAGTEAVLDRLTEVLAALESVVARMASTPGEVRASEAREVKRRTVPAAVTSLLVKQGVSLDSLGGEGMQAGALDAALGSLGVEQRIAVKSALLRAGLLG